MKILHRISRKHIFIAGAVIIAGIGFTLIKQSASAQDADPDRASIIPTATTIDFLNAATAAQFNSDQADSTAGPFTIDGVPVTFTTVAVGPAGSSLAGSTSRGIGVDSSAVQADPDPLEFNPNGESWTFRLDQPLFLNVIDWGSISGTDETIDLRSAAWINLPGIIPSTPSITYISATGTFRFTDTGDGDTWTVTQMTGGAALAIPAGASVFVGGMTSSFSPTDNLGIDTLTVSIPAGGFLNLDFGDAPNAAQSGFASSYPVTIAENGARHNPAGPFLGTARDTEADGTHSANADADVADEDGVTFGPLTAGTTGSANVIVGGVSSRVTIFIDLNQNGSWNDPGELVYNNVLGTGNNPITFPIPVSATAGITYARVRVGTVETEVNVPTGPAANGEVEDYRLQILGPTAANASVSGRVLTINGRGVSNALVHITDQDGNIRTARSNQFGYYRIEGLEVGQAYIVNVYSKQYQFTTQVINLNDSITNLNFIAQGFNRKSGIIEKRE